MKAYYISEAIENYKPVLIVRIPTFYNCDWKLIKRKGIWLIGYYGPWACHKIQLPEDNYVITEERTELSPIDGGVVRRELILKIVQHGQPYKRVRKR